MPAPADEVIVARTGAVGRLSLDRPRALNALTTGMCEAIAAALVQWRGDGGVNALIIDHAPTRPGAERPARGFCAGGDVAMVRASVQEDGGAAGRVFFHTEYRMNHLLFAAPQTTVAFMDGVTMGGGVGLALPCRYRVATENTMLAMPEGAIGLFPDVGAGWYLPRLPGRIGQFLVLTGARLDGAECLWAGLATHYLPADRVEEAKAGIARDPEATEAVLDALAIEPPPARLAGNADTIDRLFAADRLEDVLAALASDGGAWATRELAAVTGKCPTTAKVTLRLLAQRQPDFAAEMALEYAIACRMIVRHDFLDGVRAVLIDKDHAPHWNPATPEAVTEAMLDAIFAPLPDPERWTPHPAAA